MTAPRCTHISLGRVLAAAAGTILGSAAAAAAAAWAQLLGYSIGAALWLSDQTLPEQLAVIGAVAGLVGGAISLGALWLALGRATIGRTPSLLALPFIWALTGSAAAWRFGPIGGMWAALGTGAGSILWGLTVLLLEHRKSRDPLA